MSMHTKTSLDRVVGKMYGQYVKPIDRALLDMVFAENPTQAMLDECLRVCDIEALGAQKALMFSYLMREHPELRFSSYATPRLKGLIDYFRFANIQVLHHFSRIGKALNAAGIPTLIYKGAAMKILRPDLSRPMGDVDVLIPRERMKEAVSLCEELGYLYAQDGDDWHTATIRTEEGKDAVDIHCAIFGSELVDDTASDAFTRDLFARARECEAFGARVFLPAHEDLFFIVLGNLTKNLRGRTSLHGLFYALCDVHFLLRDKPSFDWEIVHSDIRINRMEMAIGFAMEFIETLLPGLVPDMREHIPFPREKMADFCDQLVFDEEFFQKRRVACQAIRVVDLKNYPWQYGTMLCKFLILKKLRKFPSFVRWYLRRQERRWGRAY